MELLTITEVAKRMKLNVKTVRKLVQDGKLEGYVLANRYRIPEQAVEDYISQGKVA